MNSPKRKGVLEALNLDSKVGEAIIEEESTLQISSWNGKGLLDESNDMCLVDYCRTILVVVWHEYI